MDKKTDLAYLENARKYSDDWNNQPIPSDIYRLIQKYFVAGGTVADIGCGNGRDASWMSQKGFKVTGYDSSQALVEIAKELYPSLDFKIASLPALSEINSKFDNVYCETVIMHLPSDQIVESIKNIKRILLPDGVLYLSWRVTENSDQRHDDGRLYSAFSPDLIKSQFDEKYILHFSDEMSASSGKRVCRLIYCNI